MVLPMPAMPAGGELPEEAQARLRTIRWVVLILIPSMFLEMFTPGLGIMKALNEFITVIAGIFLLKDDDKFKKMYECLENTPLAMCGRGGGTGCLMPYSFMAGIGFVYAMITWCQLAFSGMIMAVLQPFIVMTLVVGCQATGVYQGWKIWKSLQPDAAPSGGQGGSWGQMTNPPNSSGAGDGSGEPSSSFQAFGGSGNRLGGTDDVV